KNMEKLFEQCDNFLAALKINELLENRDKKKGKFRILINNKMAEVYKEVYKEGGYKTIEQENFHINFGYNSNDKCFFAQIEKPNIDGQEQDPQKLTWTINRKGEIKTEVNMKKTLITKEMKIFGQEFEKEGNVIIPTLINLLHLQEKVIRENVYPAYLKDNPKSFTQKLR
ncbi:MAG: hypothetical protein NZ942_04130, partial [Candidatus Aenigmarchaeota archaeon]|nr:hypothetical protein [Candidatus Aenigmarchaeota archaeon]